ncbi:MAG: ABATE domain-containing protein [Vicinamibacterales bacterium]
MTTRRSDHRFDLSSGHLALDFANTIGDRPRGLGEHLHGWDDLASWAVQAGVIGSRQCAELARLAAASPRRARGAFARAAALREQIYRIFSAVAAGRVAPAADLSRLNDALAESHARLRIRERDAGFAWAWDETAASLDRLWWPVARAAAELLASGERADVRECQAETCSWLFVDRSRTRRRRWCSMKTCGNREKVRRFYERRRAGASL